ncbi:MAG: alpha/beta hydrolase [Gemmatimonadota bacterium]
MRRLFPVLLLLGAITPTGARGQNHPAVTIPGTERRALHSEIVGDDFELYVKLPSSYGQGERAYPVLFVLDGNRSFPLYATTSQLYATPGTDNAEILVIGVAYPVDEDPLLGLADWAARRNRDLTPQRRPETEVYWERRLRAIPERRHIDVKTGGGAAFLEFLRDEAVPFVEANYRVLDDRGLAGYSLGGLFALYVLLHAPDAFDRYLVGDPTSWGILDFEARYGAAHHDLPAKLVIVTAGDSPFVSDLVGRLQAREYPGLELTWTVLDGEEHASAMPGAISRGLRILYGWK